MTSDPAPRPAASPGAPQNPVWRVPAGPSSPLLAQALLYATHELARTAVELLVPTYAAHFQPLIDEARAQALTGDRRHDLLWLALVREATRAIREPNVWHSTADEREGN